MYSLPKFNDTDFKIQELIPNKTLSDDKISVIVADLKAVVTQFVGSYASTTEFSSGRTNKDLEKIHKELSKIHDIMDKNPNILRYMELKSGATLNTSLDISVRDVNIFNSFFMSIKRMCIILGSYTDNFGTSKGRHKNNILHHESIIKEFVANLLYIYEKATGTKATIKYRLFAKDKDTPFGYFVTAVLDIINTKYPSLNNGHGIHFSITDVTRKIGKK